LGKTTKEPTVKVEMKIPKSTDNLKTVRASSPNYVLSIHTTCSSSRCRKTIPLKPKTQWMMLKRQSRSNERCILGYGLDGPAQAGERVHITLHREQAKLLAQ
jgi:hypothetical protein